MKAVLADGRRLLANRARRRTLGRRELFDPIGKAFRYEQEVFLAVGYFACIEPNHRPDIVTGADNFFGGSPANIFPFPFPGFKER